MSLHNYHELVELPSYILRLKLIFGLIDNFQTVGFL